MKKVLIVIGDVGSGHKAAAQALSEQFKISYPEVEIKVVDVFTYEMKKKPERTIVESLAKKFMENNNTNDIYEFASTNPVMNFFYNLGWKLSNTEMGKVVIKWLIKEGYKFEIQELIEEFEPDAVVSIHPLVNILVSEFKNYYHYKYFTIITDLVTLQAGWIDPKADFVISPSSEAKQTLILSGVDKEKIYYPLYPVRPQFKTIKPKEQQLKELGLSDNKVTLLAFGGGAAIYTLLKHIDRLLKTDKYQIIIVTGKSKTAKAKLDKKYKKKENVKVLGFVDTIQDIMNAADIVVSKTGPGTIIELEVLNKKAVFTRYVGAQEEGNIYYISSNPNFRYLGDRSDLVDEKVEELTRTEVLGKPKRFVAETGEIAKLIIDNI